MTIEQLLKPRIKVIADYPNSGLTVGNIFYKHVWSETGGECYFTNLKSPLQGEVLKKEHAENYPHLFKKLEWWEERDFDLSGMYVRFGELDKAHSYYKLIEPIEGMYGFWDMIGRNGSHTYPLINSIPATEKEFQDFINQKSTQLNQQ